MESIYKNIKEKCDKPVIVTEYGASAWKQVREDEESQAAYHRNIWKVISDNSYGQGGQGNALGGTAFIWCDQWSLNGTPLIHDPKSKAGDLWEWHGITSQGDGTNSPFLRQLRKVYFEYQKTWNDNKK
ncbi:MAG: hypothetical protein PHF95_05090 [bacterium]|nr:hypothetical protein [bacterium]